MRCFHPDQGFGGSSVSMCVERAGQGITTGGGRDKRAHLALGSVDCFCWSFPAHSHIPPRHHNVRRSLNPLISRHYQHIAGSSHG